MTYIPACESQRYNRFWALSLINDETNTGNAATAPTTRAIFIRFSRIP